MDLVVYCEAIAGVWCVSLAHACGDWELVSAHETREQAERAAERFTRARLAGSAWRVEGVAS